ncbi:MAG: SusC/RagA family TonB-linked outer membrane protein [Aureispira sp.]
MKQRFLLGLLCLLLSTVAYAQHRLSGKVMDQESQEPIFGALIYEKNTTTSAVSTDDGVYELTVSSDTATVVFTYLGMTNLEVQLKGNTNLDVVLTYSTASLKEVVVTALGIERQKKALGYATQEIDGATLQNVRQENLINGLAGRVAGVQITNGSTGIGSSSHIFIRGQSSLSGNNQALFVVDGIPISNELIANNTETSAAGFQEVDYGNGAGEISPDDIASINILKGPSATALYGARAANGVVVIETKSGKNKRGIGVSINSSVTAESILRLPEYQNEYGQGVGTDFAYVDGNTGDGGSILSYGPRLDGRLVPQFDGTSIGPNGETLRGGDVISRNGAPITATPWVARPNNVRDFFQTGVTFINNVALTGANDKGHFRISYTNLNNKGIVPGTDLGRHSFSVSGGYNLTERLSVKTYINYINSSSNNRPATGYGSENIMYLFTWMGRQSNVSSLKEYWQRGQEGLAQYNYNYAWMDNPYFAMTENQNGFGKHRILSNTSLNYTITEGLNLRFRNGLDYYNDLRTSKRAFSTQRFRNGAYREDQVIFSEFNTDFLLSYEKKLSEDWQFSIALGGNMMNQQLRYGSTTANELSVPGIYNFNNSRVPLAIDQYQQQKQILSLYALGQVSYKSFLFLDMTVRNDWSSTLPINNNAYAYYSFALSGIISDMVQLPKAFSLVKVRASIASVGNDTDPYNLNNTFAFGQLYGANPTVTNSSTLLNSQLLPERTTAYEFGTDLRFFQGRFNVDVTYYNNLSTNQIIELPTSTASGYVSRIANGGQIRSEGLEAIVSATPVRTKDFQWNLFANFSRNVSTVVALPEGIEQYVTGYSRVYDRSDRSVFFIATEGGRVGDMYGTGLKEVNGQQVYDANGNPVKDPELRLLGNYNPDFILGFGTEVSWKGLSLGMLWDWRQGGTIVSRTLAIASTSGVLSNTLVGRETGVVGDGVVNVGTEDNPNYVPNTTAISANNYYGQYYDRDNEANALYDASYLKLREVRLSYALPQRLVQRLHFTGIRFSLIAKNLAIFTENPHFDPELAAMQGRNFAFGVEDMSYPSSRSFGLSIQLTL